MSQHRPTVGVSSAGNPQSSRLGLTCACPHLGLILPVGKSRLCALGQPRTSLGTRPEKGVTGVWGPSLSWGSLGPPAMGLILWQGCH